MKSYIEYFILKEYNWQGRFGEYCGLKKRIVENLKKTNWSFLAAKVLEEDCNSISEKMNDSALAIELLFEELTICYKKDNVRRNIKFKRLLEQMELIKSIPENFGYQLTINNNLIQVSAYFDKNPVGTYDSTILHLILCSFVSFSKPIHQIFLKFSDETLNKVLMIY